MKNSYRNFVVNGTSALKYEVVAERRYANIVEFPVSARDSRANSSSLRIPRQAKEASKKDKFEIIVGFIVGCVLSYGTIFTMI